MSTLPSLLLGLYLSGTGVAHFVAAPYFRSLVPAWLPAPRMLVAVSGVAELVVAAGLFIPHTRHLAAWCAAVMIASFLVVWCDALRRSRSDAVRISDRPIGVAIKIVTNVGYIGWAIWAARSAG